MRAYIIRRLLLILPTFFLATLLVFFAFRFVPGSVIDLMLSEMSDIMALDREQTIANIKKGLGLDVPMYVQYGRWVGVVPYPEVGFDGLFQGSLGVSLWKGQAVTEIIIERMPVSLELGLLAILIDLSIALPLAVYSAIRQDTAGDYISRVIAILFMAVPTFWVATMVTVYPSVYLGWSPPITYFPFFDNPTQNLLQFLLPAVIMGMYTAGSTMRMTRTMMLEVLRQDYIRTAWSKGLTERTIIMRHALKNAFIPVVTIIGLLIPMLVSGSVIIEQIFCLPGMGRLVLEALTKRDYPIVSGINTVLAAAVLLINLGVDLIYAYLDPRVTFK